MSIGTPFRMGMKAADIRVDPNVQRELNVGRANAWAADFKPYALGVLAVSARPDGFYVVDGQHRREAAKITGYPEELECNVYEGLDLADEAELFIRLNTNGKPTGLDMFKIRLVRGDHNAQACMDVLTRHGWTLALGSARGIFTAVKSLEDAWKLDPREHNSSVSQALGIITAAWDREVGSGDGRILYGLARLMYANGGLLPEGRVDAGVMVRKLRTYSGQHGGLIGAAKAAAQVDKTTASTAMAKVLGIAYSAGRSVNKLTYPGSN